VIVEKRENFALHQRIPDIACLVAQTSTKTPFRSKASSFWTLWDARAVGANGAAVRETPNEKEPFREGSALPVDRAGLRGVKLWISDLRLMVMSGCSLFGNQENLTGG
jgi:hypothetical protein